jgi:hypothetical protein
MPNNRVGRALALAGALALASRLLPAATFTVTNTNDSGPGSLRQAILQANFNTGTDTIVFAIGSGPQTIAPVSALPTITDPVVIDGTTQPGYALRPLIEISGVSAGTGANGLWITAGGSVVKGLALNRFQPQFLVGGGNGILLQTGGGNSLFGNFIGVALDGTTAAGNGGDGVLISDSSANSMSPPAIAPPNLISGNSNGIRIIGASNGNTVLDALIGTNVAGTAAIPNLNSGVAILGGANNVVTSSLISGNSGDGILLSGGATSGRVQGNRIGTNADGTAAVPNGTNGIEVSGAGATGHLIGGSRIQGEGNLISGNGLNGVLIINGGTATLEGNRIGTETQGLFALPNAANGVIVSGASGSAIGRPAGISSGPAFVNVISGNGTNGVRLRSGASGNTIQNNWIGINSAGQKLPNLNAGVQINDGAVSNLVGGSGTFVFQVNWIGGNVGDGVLLADPGTTGNSIFNNSIGYGPYANPAGNSGCGVRVTAGASGNHIGDIAVGAGNLIAFNSLAGVFVESGTANTIRANSIWANGALGIDLAPAGVTANDACDADTGANDLQNFPVLSSASSSSGTVTAIGTLNSVGNASYTLDLYGNTECDPSGYGQGRFFLGTAQVPTDGSCAASFQVQGNPGFPVTFVSVTATDSAGNTSEFSPCIPVPASFYSVTPCRLIDTRGPIAALGGPALEANTDRSFGITGGECGVPRSAKAVVLTVTVTQPTAQGDLRLFPGGGTLPNTSTVNYRVGQTRASNSIVVLGPSSDFVVRCVQANGTTHFLADVTGYFE